MEKEDHRQIQSGEEWEQCKENIQPLKQGRNMDSLCNALRSEQSDYDHRQLAIQKMEFENALRLYSGDDLLEPWVSYIQWTEQHFPKGGKAGSLCPLIEKCITNFRDDDRYKNDERFVNICIKLANMSIDPPEVYSFMYGHKTGSTVATFYITWAQALEFAGDMKKADDVYIKGLQNKAQPVELLESRHREFLSRVANKLNLNESHASDEADGEDRRVAMGTLQTYGQRRRVLTTRNTATIESYVNQDHQLNIASLGKNPTGSTLVYEDASSGARNLLPETTDAKENCDMLALTGAQSTKENEYKPGRWAGVKFSQKKIAKPAIKIDVHCDVVAEQTRPVPKTYEPAAATLSEKKNADFDSLRAFRNVNTGAGQTKDVRAYNFNLVYGGVEELQFEEIRAAVYMKRKAERETEQLINEQAQRIQQMEAKMSAMQKQNADILKVVKMLLQSKGLPADRESIKLIMNQIGHPATEQDILDASIFCASGQLTLPKNPQDDVMEASTRAVPEMPVPIRTPTFKATPTIHTKEAMTIAMKIFNKPNNCSIYDQSEIQIPGQDVKDNDPALQLGFQVYQDQRTEVSSGPVSTSSQHGQKVCHEDFRKTAAVPAPKFSVYVDQCDTTLATKMENNQTTNCAADHDAIEQSNRLILGISVPSCNPRQLHPEFVENDQENVHIQREHVHLKDNVSTERDEMRATFDDADPALTAFHGSSSFVMPANTMVFVNNAKFISTPVAGSTYASSSCGLMDKVEKPSADLNVTSAIASETGDVICGSNVRFTNKEREVQLSSLTHTIGDVEKKFLNLSTIIETSRDYKSSSGSSGTSSGAASHFRTTFTYNKTGVEVSSLREKSEHLPATIEHQTERDASSVHEDNRAAIQQYADPFNTDLIKKFLDELSVPIFNRSGVVVMRARMPAFTTKSIISVNGGDFVIGERIGAGAYASIYRVNQLGDMSSKNNDGSLTKSLVIKVQSPPSTWDFYIADELKTRLDQLHFSIDINKSIMHISHLYIFDDGSVFTTEFHKCTLLDLVNRFTKSNQTMSEALVMYLTIEILHILEQIHACNIIHADVKPDNFLIMDVPPIQELNTATPFGRRTCLVKIIDYGRCIDMTLFPNGTEFKTRVDTEFFDCIEMKENRSWSYQTDLYGLASTVHVMLFGKYMEPKKKANGREWQIGQTIRRYWQASVWNQFFDQLLNIPSSNELPNLAELRKSLERCLVSCPKMPLELKMKINELRAIYNEMKC